MNEQRAFTVVVTGCMNCPFHTTSTYNDTNVYDFCDEGGGDDAFSKNKDAITPSCPMWSESKPIGELK